LYIFLALSALFALGLMALIGFMMWMNTTSNDFLSSQMPEGDLSEALENLTVFKFLLYGFDLANGPGIAAVIAIALFAGREYSTGIIRNKIIAGHSRSLVYLSSCVASTAFAFATLANCVTLLSRNNIAALLINLGVVYGLVIILSLLDFIAMARADMKPFVDAVKSVVYAGQCMLIGDECTLAYFLKSFFSSGVALFVINAAGCAVFK
jgi:hypothetical protein